MIRALREHWPEYLCEAAELGLFMISAGLFTILLHHPESSVVGFIPSEFTRRLLTGIAMGSTAIALVFSPLGKRSGAHFNPAVTLTFWRLGKVKNWDAVFYIIAQFIGAIGGVFAITLFAREALSHPTVNYAATLPGMQGVIVAFVAEFVIAFVLMSVVLRVSNTPHLARYTGLFAGALVATYITLESPLSGMSNESGAFIRLRVCRSPLDGALDLLHCTYPGDAAGCSALHSWQADCLLCEISSLQSTPLHF